MSDRELDRFLKFNARYFHGTLITVPSVICKTLFDTEFNNYLNGCDRITLQIVYIGFYGFTGVIYKGVLDNKYFSREVSISYKSLNICGSV